MEENKDEKETKEKKMKSEERLVYDELIRPYSTKKSKEFTVRNYRTHTRTTYPRRPFEESSVDEKEREKHTETLYRPVRSSEIEQKEEFF